MSVRSQGTSGPPAAAEADGAPLAGRPSAPSALRAPDTAGLTLARLTVLPTLLVLPFLLAAFPLLLAGWFRPAPVLVLSLALAAVTVPFGLRWIPSVGAEGAPAGGGSAGTWPAAEPGPRRTPWWAVGGVLAVAAVFGGGQLAHHSQFIIVVRDPASYVQFAAWIAGHGSLPIPQDHAAFGAARGLNFSSFAFYQAGHTVVPQFMAGLPMVLAAGFWAGGVNLALVLAPLLGAAAVLTFGGLVARLAGPRWAPLAALALALSLPEMFTSRSTYSEPLAQILFLGGLCLVIDALRAGRAGGAGARVIAALGGLALGITLLVRIDGASDTLPLIPYCGLLLLARRRQAAPLIGGFAAGTLYGALDGLVLSRPYLKTNISSVRPLALATGAVVAVTALAVMLLWHRGLPRVRGRWLPGAAAAAPFAVTAAFAVRPYVEKAGKPDQYAPISLHWVFWYIGVPAVVLATLAAALLSRRCLRGQAPDWVLPLLTFSWTIVTCLYRPAITPDQPWASRRLVPAVLPGFILLAVWAVAWAAGRVRRAGYGGAPGALAVACCGAALVLPAAMTSFGLGIRHLRPAANGVALTTTYAGEIAAVSGMCAAIPRDSSVVFIDGPLADRLTEIVRGMCGDPAARLYAPKIPQVRAVIRDTERAGRRPVLIGRDPGEFNPYHQGTARKIMTLKTTMDATDYTTWPRSTQPLQMTVWMWEAGR